MSKVSYVDLKSAVVGMSNAVDSERTYEIKANVNVSSGSNVGSIDSGEVCKLGETNVVATFSSWGSQNLSLNLNGLDATEYCDCINAINDFIDEVKTEVAENGLISTLSV